MRITDIWNAFLRNYYRDKWAYVNPDFRQIDVTPRLDSSNILVVTHVEAARM